MKKKFMCILLLIASICVMHYFSTQDGVTSANQSNTAIQIIDKIREKVTLKNNKLEYINEKIQNKLKPYGKSFVVRKMAHFSMYALIGGVGMIVIFLFSENIFMSASLSFVFTVLYALFDEFTQLGIDGRDGNIIDVFIDSSGCFVAITALTILFLIQRGIKHIFNKNKKD